MGALDPIAGISLEYYADLCAKMKDCGGDSEDFVRIAQENGVDRGRWEAAMNGWNERMANPATAGEVALAYMPLYQAALAKVSDGIATASLEDYAGMYVMLNEPRYGLDAMYAHYGIDVHKWSQISMYWVDRLTKDMALNQHFAGMVQPMREHMGGGGAPPPPGRGEKPTGVTGDDVVKAASAITSLPPVAVGENCFVLWSDGNKYPGRVAQAADGQCLITFPNGRQDWIPNKFISNS